MQILSDRSYLNLERQLIISSFIWAPLDLFNTEIIMITVYLIMFISGPIMQPK